MLRLSKKDLERISKTNQFIKNKKKRLYKNYKVSTDIEPIDINKITSRKELNDFYFKARMFKNSSKYRFKKNKYNFVMSQYDINKMKYLTSNINSKRKSEWNKVKNKAYTLRGKQVSTLSERKWMGSNKYGSYNLLSFNFESFESLKQWNARKEHLEAVSKGSYYKRKNEQLKQNILTSIATYWGIDGYDAYKMIENMSADEVVKEFESEDIFSMDIFGSPNIFSKNEIKMHIDEFYKVYGLGKYSIGSVGTGKRLVV